MHPTSAVPRVLQGLKLPPPGVRAPALRQLLRALSGTPVPAAALQRCDAAAAIGVREAELVAAHAGCFDRAESPLAARRLRVRRRDIAAALARFGRTRSVAGHRACRVERLGPACAPEHWAHAFALEQRGADGSLARSLQFFDAAGDSLAELTPLEAAGVAAWLDLVEACACFEPAPRPLAARRVRAARPADEPADAATLRRAWGAMRTPDGFEALLARFALSPAQACRLAGPDFARRVVPTSAHELLTAAAQQGVRLSVEVPGAGACGGDWRAVHQARGWTQAETAGVRLHLREDAVAEAWLLGCPSLAGLRQTLLLLDATGAPIARLGDDSTVRPERCGWRRLVAQLEVEVDA
ncbi:ChuX/HutX family heme-like substrate-binding protein [Rubrivivax gelatinosus]|uniref:Putative hemin transport protein n=1 Tax=Rubrivivax gelatinosus TaxID=28068 RepID=A0A4R2MEY1_RUBGE|nr:ChuX/HutX family heme-like substrate-binding protein [Rubrivivax gelatinosus]TCP05412.1 putative hemin transport protein [Rubrivivax gelatinosus]